MTDPISRPAYIYCRVSSTKQVREGHGLESQESRCREFTARKDYDVIDVFYDEGISGGLIERPGMKKLLAALASHKTGPQPVAIIDDISRLARGIHAHVELRIAIANAGGQLESPSVEFGEDSDSILVENLLASVAQHQRQKNAEQVVNRMKARIMAGYWVFSPVAGYRYETVEGHGQMLVPDEPNATAVREAMEGFASGRFESQAEVRAFLETFPSFPRTREGVVNLNFIPRLLTRSLYAGYMDVPKWNIRLQPGKHEPLVSFETWQKVQDRLNGKHKQAPVRADTTLDFPLRGFVTCSACHKPMTAAWSKGRNARYGYYFCQTRGCENRRKNIPKPTIEGGFEALLKTLKARPELLSIFRRMLEAHWQNRIDGAAARSKQLTKEVRQIEGKIEGLMERLIACDSPTLITAYEDQIKKFEARKIALGEQARMKAQPLESFEKAYRTACAFLANPLKLWASEHLEHKRMVLKLAFAGRIPYDPEKGYRTADPALPFKALSRIGGPTGDLVEPRGVEPLTS